MAVRVIVTSCVVIFVNMCALVMVCVHVIGMECKLFKLVL